MGSPASALTAPPPPPGFQVQGASGPPPLPPGFELAKPYGVGDSLKNQAKSLFDTLSSLVDPHIGQKIGDAAIDAQIDQWHHAKAEYEKGNYANAFRRGLAAAVPFLGPTIENAAETITTPGQMAGGITDLAALPIAAELGPRVPAGARLLGRGAAATVDATRAVAGHPLTQAALKEIPLRDLAGVLSPRLAHGVAVADRVKGIVQRIREAMAVEPEPPPPQGVNTNQPAALQNRPIPFAGTPASRTQPGVVISQGATAGLPTPEPQPVPPQGVNTNQAAALQARPTPFAGTPASGTQPGVAISQGGTAGIPTPPVASSLKNDIAAGLGAKSYETLTPRAKTTVDRIADRINGQGAATRRAAIVPRGTPPEPAAPQISTAVEIPEENAPNNKIRDSVSTVPPPPPGFQVETAPGGPSPQAAAPAATAAPAVATAAPPKEFGQPAGAAAPGAQELPVLPGHQKMASSMAHSAGFDPSTGEPQIHFGPSKSAPGGTLYRYVDTPDSGLPPVVEEFKKALNAESFGAYFREHIRPKYKGIRIEVPSTDKGLLEGVSYGKVPTSETGTLNPAGPASTQPSAGGQGASVPAENGARAPAPPESISTTSVRVPGSDKSYRARYEVRELSDIQASHSGATFQPNPKYKNFNDRDYTQRENQGKVLNNSMAKTFDPAFLITDNPDATNGPPVLESTGDVLGGNGRTMILHRVYGSNPTGAAAYKALLAKKAAQFGVDPAQLAGMKQPVLVRVVDHAEFSKPEGVQDAVTDFNKKGTAELTPSERALADARRVSLSTLDDVAGKLEASGSTATLADALKGKSGTAVLDKLIDDGVISPQERAAYAADDALTKEGQARISKLLLGRFFRDPAQLDTTPPAIRTKIERIAAPLARVEGAAEWNLTPKIQEAMDLIEDARAHGSRNIEYFLKQEGLLSAHAYSADAVTLAKALQNATVKGMADAVNSYAQDAQFAGKGPGLFGEAPAPAKSFEDAFGALTKKAKPAPKAKP